jgi:hypothetical protein
MAALLRTPGRKRQKRPGYGRARSLSLVLRRYAGRAEQSTCRTTTRRRRVLVVLVDNGVPLTPFEERTVHGEGEPPCDHEPAEQW